MNIVLIGCFLAALTSTFALAARLRTTQRELERTRRRMARLDEIADDVAEREYHAGPTAWVTPDPDPTPIETPMPSEVDVARDSGKFEPVGLQFNTEDVIETEDDFAAPRMTRETDRIPSGIKQQPGRERHETPVGSPRNLTPRTPHSVVSVGKIQVRSEHVTPHDRD